MTSDGVKVFYAKFADDGEWDTVATYDSYGKKGICNANNSDHDDTAESFAESACQDDNDLYGSIDGYVIEVRLEDGEVRRFRVTVNFDPNFTAREDI